MIKVGIDLFPGGDSQMRPMTIGGITITNVTTQEKIKGGGLDDYIVTVTENRWPPHIQHERRHIIHINDWHRSRGIIALMQEIFRQIPGERYGREP